MDFFLSFIFFLLFCFVKLKFCGRRLFAIKYCIAVAFVGGYRFLFQVYTMQVFSKFSALEFNGSLARVFFFI